METKLIFLFLILGACSSRNVNVKEKADTESKPCIIITSDGEIDDECSMVGFLLYTNEWDVEGIITSSSQYHSQSIDNHRRRIPRENGNCS